MGCAASKTLPSGRVSPDDPKELKATPPRSGPVTHNSTTSHTPAVNSEGNADAASVATPAQVEQGLPEEQAMSDIDALLAPGLDIDALLSPGLDMGAPQMKKRPNSFLAPEVMENPEGNGTAIPLARLGFYSRCGYKQGATINQDRGIVTHPFPEEGLDRMLLGVYDGHGREGQRISEAVAFQVAELMQAHAPPGKVAATPENDELLMEALNTSLVGADDWLLENMCLPAEDSGTTAIVCVLSEHSVLTGCVGDSRAVLGRVGETPDKWTAVELSTDHKCDAPEEMARLVAAGGAVEPASDGYGSAVWKHEIGLGKALAMSRSIGDHGMGRNLVINTPTVTKTSLQEDACLILASDGVWEFLSSQQAMDIVHAHRAQGATEACRALIEAAASEWQAKEEDYRDDITAIVVFLPIFDRLDELPGQGVPSLSAAAGGEPVSPRPKNSTIMSGSAENSQVPERSPNVRPKDRLSVRYGDTSAEQVDC
jgi:protein phosphatase 2C family protein 2/3